MITRYQIIKIHDTAIRTRGKCTECGMTRLRTQVDLKDDRGRIIAEHLCNECLTRTPPWS